MPELPESLSSSSFAPARVAGSTTEGEVSFVFNWWALATATYLFIAGLLLLRLAVGLYLTWRLVRVAKPLNAAWADGADVRVSDLVGGPVTFGSTIVLPSHYGDWDISKRQAVLAHEGAHVANRDFYLLLLASLNRAVFWFSPFAWWQSIRLAELAEMISDARALEVVDDRLSYAQILLDLVQHVRQAPTGLEMARACTVRTRVERILDGSAIPVTGGWRKRLWTGAAIAPVVMVSAVSIAYIAPARSTLVSDSAVDATAVASNSEMVDFYAFRPGAILAIFRDGESLYGQLTSQRKFRLSAAPNGAMSYPASGGPITWRIGHDRRPFELMLHQNGREIRAVRIAATFDRGTETGAASTDTYLGWYELASTRALTVTRDGTRIYAQETGQPRSEIRADGGDTFAGNNGVLIIFLRDDQGQVTGILHQDPLFGARLAPRIAVAQAKAIEEGAARRLAEAPDRFRGQAPLPGSKDAVLRGIADMQNGTPDYASMTAALAVKVRRHAAEMQEMLKTLGAVESIFFRGVGPGGYDIYGVKFANGSAEIRLLQAADGKADDVIFRPDGDSSLGFIRTCSDETRLKPHAGTAPISVFFYNDTGKDMQLYELDAEGKRIARGTVGNAMSSTVWTTVDRPWVVTDASGQCLQVVLPGLRTRFNTIEGAQGIERWNSPRTTPMAGSEEMLRQYIEATVRGQPDYDRMTSQVAAFTREQLPLNRAILSKLGALQALSFRGVSGSGNDIYMAHFANGTAEWRIGLVKDHTIGRIALGPQY
jgi:hypothetical protein